MATGKARRNFGKRRISEESRIAGTERESNTPNTFESVPQASQNILSNPSQYFKKTGDVLNGPFAFGPVNTLGIVAGILVINTDVSAGSITKRSVVNVEPQTGTVDSIDNIIGGIFDNEILILVGTAGNTITLNHNTGGNGTILCPGDAAYTLSGDEMVMLVQTTTPHAASAAVWRVLDSSAGGGGAGDNLGNHTATMDLDMVSNGILDWSTLRMAGIEANTGAIRIINNAAINWRDNADTADFGINLNTSDNLAIDTNLDMQTNGLLDWSTLRMSGTEASAGAIRLINNSGISWRNAANSADHTLILNASDDFEIDTGLDVNNNKITDIGAATITDLAEETTPAAGDFLLGVESGGAVRKFDVGDLPAGAGDNLGDHLATQDLDMDGYDIILDQDGESKIINSRNGVDNETQLNLGGAVHHTFQIDNYTLEHTSGGVAIDLVRDALVGSPPNIIGQLRFFTQNSGTNVHEFASIEAYSETTTSAGEEGRLDFDVFEGGSGTTYIDIDGSTERVNIYKPTDLNNNALSNYIGFTTQTAGQATTLDLNGETHDLPVSDTYHFKIDGNSELTVSATTVDVHSNTISNVVDPTLAQDAATKAYVDAQVGGGPEFSDTLFRVFDNADNTKKVAFQVSGVTTATTRELTIPDNPGTLALLNTDQTFTGDITFQDELTVSTPAGDPNLFIFGDATSGTDIGHIKFQGNDDGIPTLTTFAEITGKSESNADPNERGSMNFRLVTDSGLASYLTLNSSTTNITVGTGVELDVNSNKIANIDPTTITDLTEDASPTTGDWLMGVSGGNMRKFDVGNLPGGGGGISFPIQPTITDNSDTWTGTQTLNLDTGDGHVYKWIIDQDLTFAASVTKTSISAGEQRTFELEFEHDEVGGTFTITLPSNFIDGTGKTIASIDLSTGTAILTCRINDGTNFIVLRRNVAAIAGGVSALSELLIDVDKNWNDKEINNFKGLVFNTTGAASATQPKIWADTSGDMVFNVASADQFFWTSNDVTIGRLIDAELEVRTTTEDGPILNLFNNDATPTALDRVGAIEFKGQDDLGATVTYGSIRVDMDDPVNTSKDATFEINAMSQNSIAKIVDYSGGDAVWRFSANVDVVRPNRDNGIDLGSVSQSWQNGFMAGYTDYKSLATPADPAAGTRRLFTDTTSGELSVRTSAGVTVSLEAASGLFNIVEDLTPQLGASLDAQGFDITDADEIVFGSGTGSDEFVIGRGADILTIQCGDAGTGVSADQLRFRRGTSTKLFLDETGWNFTSEPIGFFGATPISKPTVSGSRADTEAALADLLNELANLGLITDSTSA